MAKAGADGSGVTLTVRLIRSFEYRNIKFLVLKGVPLSLLVSDFTKLVDNEIQTSSKVPLPFKKHKYDCLKIHCFPQGAKTSDTAINTDREDWILEPDKTLAEYQIKNETEISYFNRQEYERYKTNPQLLW